MGCFACLFNSAPIEMDVLRFEQHRCNETAQTYPVLSEIHSRKTPLADLLASSELANNLVGFVFRVRRWWWATTHSSWWHSLSRHVRCVCLIRLFHFPESSSVA